jgi:hypothetical protein
MACVHACRLRMFSLMEWRHEHLLMSTGLFRWHAVWCGLWHHRRCLDHVNLQGVCCRAAHADLAHKADETAKHLWSLQSHGCCTRRPSGQHCYHPPMRLFRWSSIHRLYCRQDRSPLQLDPRRCSRHHRNNHASCCIWSHRSHFRGQVHRWSGCRCCFHGHTIVQ